MPQYRVTLISSTPAGVITHDGYLGKTLKLHIRAVHGTFSTIYEGHGGGKLLEERCQRLLAADGVVVEAAEPGQYGPDAAWEQTVIDVALAESDKLTAA